MSELSLEKQAKVLGTLQSMLNTSKEGVKSFAKNVSGSGVKAEKAAVEAAKVEKASIAKGGGKNAKKAKAKKHRELEAKIQQGPKNIGAAEAATAKARKQLAIGAGGVAAAGAGALALRAALKRGSSKGLASLTKKEKLIKMMKKNPKATAAAGVGGGVGLAALLSK